MALIEYYGYTDATHADKQKLADILQGLKDAQPRLIVDLNAMQASGQFERLSRILLPYASEHLADFDDAKQQAIIYAHPELGITNVETFKHYIEQEPGLHLVDNGSGSVFEIERTDLLTKKLHLDTTVPVISHASDQDHELQVLSETQLQRQRLPFKDIPMDIKIKHYVISRKASIALAKRFKREFMAAFGKKPASFPEKDTGLEAYMYQLFLLDYRQTILKMNNVARPVLFVPRVDMVPLILSMMTDSKHYKLEQWDETIKSVDAQRVFDSLWKRIVLPLDAQGHIPSGSPSQTKASLSSLDIQEGYDPDHRLTVQFTVRKADNELDGLAELDVVSGEKPVFSQDGHLMRVAAMTSQSKK